MQPKDKLGQIITVGSIIAYGHALGRCAGLRIGIVKKIREMEMYRYPEDQFRFTVRGIEDDWSYKDPWDYEKRELCSKDGTLAYVNRIIVLKADQVPQHYWNILKTHYESSIS